MPHITTPTPEHPYCIMLNPRSGAYITSHRDFIERDLRAGYCYVSCHATLEDAGNVSMRYQQRRDGHELEALQTLQVAS